MSGPSRNRDRRPHSEDGPKYHVAYVGTQSDALAHHITRLAGDDVQLDEIEQLLVALQRSGGLTRVEMVQLQASYLREARR